MKIWIIDHYSVPQKYYPLIRNTTFAKKLQTRGHEVIIFAASTVHNSDENLVASGEKYREIVDNGVRYVLVGCHCYSGNGLKRRLNMLEFAWKLPSVCKKYKKPDVIISTSMTPFACAQGLRIAKKSRCKKIAQITDLWPESIVAYGYAKRNNPIIKMLYILEKWIYKNADSIVFSMEGGKDYIIEKGWDSAHGGPIDLSKVHHINNGVDIKVFDYNKENYIIEDPELDDCNIKIVIYTGSMREANRSITVLPEVADELLHKGRKDIRILMYGKGDYVEIFKKICEERPIRNLVYKGFVQKNEIPYLLSKAVVCILNCDKSEMSKYGSSQNKLFDYLASGHPILSGESDKYSIINNRNCGISKQFDDASEIADAIIELVDYPEKYPNSRLVSEEYDFDELTKHLMKVIEA